jgi:putative acyl-CoA dehydrogenase
MTYAAVPALRNAPKLAALWEPKFAAKTYDPQLESVAVKTSALCGMGMTEKQGGSDVRANTTRAVRQEEDTLGTRYAVTGHKWFCSAPMCDAFLILAQAPAGLSCFLLPRVLPDGSRNVFAIQRLKDKLGNRSNASSEVEFTDSAAWLVGEEGRGVQTIIEMVNSTRLDCVNGSASLVRQALVQALHHARHRSAFGSMQNVLADLALESEAAMRLMLRLARCADRAPHDPHEALLKRFGTAVAKYWVCKRAPVAVAEALECLGGNGYVEESMMPRLYREAPLNSIWEGSGNINALDVLRALEKTPDAYAAYRLEIQAIAAEPAVAALLGRVEREMRDAAAQANARRCVETLAILWQYALLRADAPDVVADAFFRSRIAGDGGRAIGTLPGDTPFGPVLERAFKPGF